MTRINLVRQRKEPSVNWRRIVLGVLLGAPWTLIIVTFWTWFRS